MNKIISFLLLLFTILAYQNCGTDDNSMFVAALNDLEAGVSATDTGNGGIITSNYVQNLNVLIQAICTKNKEDNGEDPEQCDLNRFGGDIAYLNLLTDNKDFTDHLEYHEAQMQNHLRLQEPQYSNCLQYVNTYSLPPLANDQEFIFSLLDEPNCSKVIFYIGN